MRFIKSVTLILIAIVAVSCEEKEQLHPETDNQLIGHWTNMLQNDTLWTFERVTKLPENAYGFVIKSNYQFIERKNVGWCGTPPVSYGDYEGSWAMSDTILNINVPYWGGMAEYQWKLISVDENILTIYQLNVEFNSDNP